MSLFVRCDFPRDHMVSKWQKQNFSQLSACTHNHYDSSINMQGREIKRGRVM